MKGLKIFGAALLMAVSKAQGDAEDVELEGPEAWKDKCFHCIDEGYMFCSADGISGTCMDVTCKEYSMSREEKDAAKENGVCTLVAADEDVDINAACPSGGNANLIKMAAYS